MTQALSEFNRKIGALLARRPVIMQLLRFAAIGALNTALDFIILNYITKRYGIDKGASLGLLNVLSFSAAVIQSYLWNKAWAFAESRGGLMQNLNRLVLVGGLGFVSLVGVLFGANLEAVPAYYLMILVGFVVVQIGFWFSFRLSLKSGAGGVAAPAHKHMFSSFLLISLVGLLINSGVIALASNIITPYLSGYISADLIKNAAKVLATGFSLVWNFLGYKLIVFKK